VKLKQLKIHNYRVFYKTNIFAFPVKERETIVLINARNGYGKTSILDAVKIALYGAKNDDIWHPKDAYLQWMRESLNYKSFGERDNILWIELILETSSGSPQEIAIRREYYIGETIEETLRIKENDIPLKLDRLDLEDYIEEVILPHEWSSFFLFDGEKIGKLADEIEYKERGVLENIKKLLRVGLYEYALVDLREVRKSILKDLKDSMVQAKIAQIEAERKGNKQQIEFLEEEVKTLIEEKYNIQKELEEIKKEIRRLGFKNKGLENIEIELEKISNEFLKIKEELASYMKEELPLLILFPLINKVIPVLEKEKEARTKYEAVKELKDKVESKRQELERWLKAFIKEDVAPKNLEYLVKVIAEQFVKKWEEIFAVEVPMQNMELGEEISPRDYEFITKLPLNINASKLHYLLDEYSRIFNKRRKLFKERNSLPKDSEYINDLFSKQESFIKEIGQIEKEIEYKQREIKEKICKNNGLEKQIERLQDRLKQNEYLNVLNQYMQKIEIAVKNYIDELIKVKREEFEEVLNTHFKTAFFKKDEVGKIEVNSDFSIGIQDYRGNYLKKDKLSAGEKQILALAILQTLAKLTGKEYFVIIDTPLGRLDDYYRQILVKEVFPHLSQQVIILSTPEEIRDEYYQFLQKHISKEYRLEYWVGNSLSKIYEV